VIYYKVDKTALLTMSKNFELFGQSKLGLSSDKGIVDMFCK